MTVRGTLTAGDFLCGTSVHSDAGKLSGRVVDVSAFLFRRVGECVRETTFQM